MYFSFGRAAGCRLLSCSIKQCSIIKIKSEEARCLYYSGVQPNTFLWRILHKTFNLNYKTFNEIKIKSVFKQMANVILYALKSTGCRVNVLAIGSAILPCNLFHGNMCRNKVNTQLYQSHCGEEMLWSCYDQLVRYWAMSSCSCQLSCGSWFTKTVGHLIW